MYKLNDIKSIHLELTSKCQARCPMCPRRISGGVENPMVAINDITIDTFKKWFSNDFIKQLDKLFMCGNLGDPIIGQDCLEIFAYLRETNPDITLSMHTNGSARNNKFWERLAELKVKVIFGIDGLSDTHKLYRIDTDFRKIMENASVFIRNGGHAEWHMLVFEHNEHQVEECNKLADSMGFKHFSIKNTTRFRDHKFNVIDDTGKTVHVLKPTQRSKEMIMRLQEAINVEKPYVSCKAQKNRELYVSASGIISPCCWLDLSWVLPSQDNRVDYMDKIGLFPSLNNMSLIDIFDSGFFNNISETWTNKPLLECSKQCGSFDKCGEQFK